MDRDQQKTEKLVFHHLFFQVELEWAHDVKYNIYYPENVG